MPTVGTSVTDFRKNMETVAYIVLRVVFAWMFLWPIKGLLADWKATQNMVAMICPASLVGIGSIGMVLVMVLGALSILLGVLPQIGGAVLTVFCLIGASIHYRLGASAAVGELSKEATAADRDLHAKAVGLAAVGNITSAEKNFVLAAVGLFFALAGTGPYSLLPFCCYCN
jgi:uncharacterized membrane protein YphA (DoxX/SURF4 family)